jgi:hypothetical protein
MGRPWGQAVARPQGLFFDVKFGSLARLKIPKSHFSCGFPSFFPTAEQFQIGELHSQKKSISNNDV